MVATTRPSGVASTAASSPMPTSVLAFGGSPADTALIRPNSPSEASVCGSFPAMPTSATPLRHGGRACYMVWTSTVA